MPNELISDPVLLKRVRLLRKKLKQIEILKLLGRKLNTEEVAKIERQDEYREELLDILTHASEIQAEQDAADDVPLNEEEPSVPPPQVSSLLLVGEVAELSLDDKEIGEGGRGDDLSSIRAPTIESQDKASSSPTSHVKVVKSEKTSSPTRHVDPIVAIRRTWNNRHFELIELAGHTDIIRSVDITRDYIVSGSRDTSVKLWSSQSGEPLQNFGGHTGQVNAVKLVQCQGPDSKPTAAVVSGGEDCSVKFWNISTGALMAEFYVYNSVTCFAVLGVGPSRYLVAGLDGGKLEVYDLQSMKSHLSHSADADRITSLSADGDMLAVAGDDGLVEVLQLGDGAMRRLYSLDENITESVKSVALRGGHMILGDDEPNIKHLHWKRNTDSSLANHHTEFGVTDALCLHNNCLFSSAYDYDAGLGYINVRDMSENKYEYVTSISDPDILHILSIAVTSSGQGETCGPISVVTGGMQLVLWREDVTRSLDSVKCKTRRLHLADSLPLSESEDSGDVDSDMSDVETSDEESDNSQPSSDWWCVLL